MYAGFCGRILYSMLGLNIVNNFPTIQLYLMTVVFPDINVIYIYLYTYTYMCTHMSVVSAYIYIYITVYYDINYI